MKVRGVFLKIFSLCMSIFSNFLSLICERAIKIYLKTKCVSQKKSDEMFNLSEIVIIFPLIVQQCYADYVSERVWQGLTE